MLPVQNRTTDIVYFNTVMFDGSASSYSNVELEVKAAFLSDVIISLFCYVWRGMEMEFSNRAGQKGGRCG
jgi:hypothetical protein